MTKLERDLIERIRELEQRVAVLEALPCPIVFAVSQYQTPLQADMHKPSEAEH